MVFQATIENDYLGETDLLLLVLDTAVNTILQAINEIRDTAKAHRRTFIIEEWAINAVGLLHIQPLLVAENMVL